MKINDSDYQSIIPTSLTISKVRKYTDIPYEDKIAEWLDKNFKHDEEENKRIAPEIEARYKLINQILDHSHIKQVYELASGYSSRGLIYAKKDYNYIEIDLDNVINNKVKMIKTINKSTLDNLHLISGNVLKENDFNKCQKYLKKEEVAIINEGLMRYFTFEEKALLAKNIYNILTTYGGIWITSDVTPKSFITSQDKSVPNFNKNISNITNRNNINYRFEDIDHVKNFYNNLGFDCIEIHKFKEIINDLYSINKFKIFDEKIANTLDNAIVVVMKVKKR